MSLENEIISHIPWSYVNPAEFKKLHKWFSSDVWKEFQDSGHIFSCISLEPNHMVLVHLIQPNRLHFLGRYDSETNILKNGSKRLDKKANDKVFEGKHPCEGSFNIGLRRIRP